MPSPRGSRLQAATAARRKAEEALDKSERRYRALVEHSLGLICIHDLEGRLISVNPAAERSLGYEPGQGVGQYVQDFLAPETRHLFADYLQSIRSNGNDAGLMRVVAQDGSERIWAYSNILYHEEGRAPYVLGHALDISERIRAERALRENEQALKTAYTELDARVRERTAALTEANARLQAEIVERRRAEETRERALLRERDTLAFHVHVTEALAGVTDANDALTTLSRLPVPFLADCSLLHVLNDDGSVRSVTGTHADPTRHPELSRLADVSTGSLHPDSAIALALADHRPKVISATTEDVAQRYLGDSGASHLVAALGIRRIAVLPVVMDNRPIAALSLALTREPGFTLNDLALADDLVRRFRLAYERVRLFHAAREANRLKEEFLSTLSHELRTPLNAILGWSRILRVLPLDAGVARGVEVIERNAEAQTRLIEEILDVSRIVTGKLRLQLETVPLAGVARAALDAIRPTAQAKGVRLDERLEGSDAVRGDAHRLQQVVVNLLSNAVKFTDARGVITLAVRRTGEAVELEVADTGAGIRRDVLPFVFDRFRQADSSTTRRHGGLGLGLAIVRHLVELHGGSVTAHSAGEGLGARFTVRLPAASPASDRMIDESVPGGDDRVETTPMLQGRVVLIVDDDRDARDLLSAVLASAGATAVTAGSSLEAMGAIARGVPDLIVADIGMPEEDGYTFIRRVRALASESGGRVPAIALTAYARAEDRDRALAAGFDRHVVKPIDPGALVGLVASMT